MHICVYMCVCVYIYIYIYTHTYTTCPQAFCGSCHPKRCAAAINRRLMTDDKA